MRSRVYLLTMFLIFALRAVAMSQVVIGDEFPWTSVMDSLFNSLFGWGVRAIMIIMVGLAIVAIRGFQFFIEHIFGVIFALSFLALIPTFVEMMIPDAGLVP